MLKTNAGFIYLWRVLRLNWHLLHVTSNYIKFVAHLSRARFLQLLVIRKIVECCCVHVIIDAISTPAQKMYGIRCPTLGNVYAEYSWTNIFQNNMDESTLSGIRTIWNWSNEAGEKTKLHLSFEKWKFNGNSAFAAYRLLKHSAYYRYSSSMKLIKWFWFYFSLFNCSGFLFPEKPYFENRSTEIYPRKWDVPEDERYKKKKTSQNGKAEWRPNEQSKQQTI